MKSLSAAYLNISVFLQMITGLPLMQTNFQTEFIPEVTGYEKRRRMIRRKVGMK